MAARAELEGEKRLPEGAAWRWGEPADEACRMARTGWYRQVTITEKEGRLERKTNLTLPSYVWVGGKTAKWQNAAEGETIAAFLCLFGMSDPPPPKEKITFCLGCASLMKHRGSTLGGKCGRSCNGVGASTGLGGTSPPPKSVCDATASWVQSYVPKGGRPTKYTKRGAKVVVIESDAPPNPKGKAPTPSPKPSKVAKVVAHPPDPLGP